MIYLIPFFLVLLGVITIVWGVKDSKTDFPCHVCDAYAIIGGLAAVVVGLITTASLLIWW